MALQYFLCFAVLGKIVTGCFGQDDYGPAGPNGYDLKQGPVFYEAYPDDQLDDFPGDYREKRFFDRDAMRERSFQLPTEYPYDGHPIDVSHFVADNVPNIDRRISEFDFPSGDNYFPHSVNDMNSAHARSNEQRLPFEEDDRKLSRSRRAEGRSAFETMRTKDEISDINSAIWPALYWQDIPRKVGNYREELARTDSRILPREFNNLNLIRRASSGPRYLENQGLMPNDPRTYWSTNSRPLPMPQKYAKRIDNSELWKAVKKRLGVNRDKELMENIFEPRPQIINYVFSKKTAKSTAKQSAPLTNLNTENKESADQAVERPKNEPEVASIQVSEIPKHKTRHHHGEWLMRENSRHFRS